MIFLDRETNMLCCQIQRNKLSLLPFTSTLFKGFYDGPLDGLTTCEICNKGYFYREIEYIDIRFRIYRFTEINIPHYKFAEKFGILIKQGDFIEFPKNEKAEHLYSEFGHLPITHMCLMGGYLKEALLWRKARCEDLIVLNWEEYFGITINPETEEYELSGSGKGWAIT